MFVFFLCAAQKEEWFLKGGDHYYAKRDFFKTMPEISPAFPSHINNCFNDTLSRNITRVAERKGVHSSLQQNAKCAQNWTPMQ